ncbi:hypothetical protein D3C71_2097550 [compost metagenome]
MEGLHATANQLGKVEIDMFQFQVGALDPREIENVVDHLEQVAGRFTGHGSVFGLFFAQGSGFE